MTNHHFTNETMLLGYGESDTSGCWIKLQVLPEHLDLFRGLKGKIFDTTLDFVDESGDGPDPVGEVQAEMDGKGPHGQFARRLFLSPLMRSPDLWKVLGTPEDYEIWVRNQPCIVTGDFDHADGEPRNIFAHVLAAHHAPDREDMKRRNTYKPAYRGVPMKNEIHQLQHNEGITAIWQIAMADKDGNAPEPDREKAQQWLEQCALAHVREWAKERIAAAMGVPSLTWVDPEKFVPWIVAQFRERGYVNTWKMLPSPEKQQAAALLAEGSPGAPR